MARTASFLLWAAVTVVVWAIALVASSWQLPLRLRQLLLFGQQVPLFLDLGHQGLLLFLKLQDGLLVILATPELVTS